MDDEKNVVFEDSPLWLEVQDILKEQTKTVYDIEGTIHTPKEDIGVWDMNQIEILRDYLGRTQETINVMFKMPMGDYVHRLYPFRTNMEFTLTYTPKSEMGNAKITDIRPMVTRYKVIFNANNNPPVGGSEMESQSERKLNNIDFVDLTLELAPREGEVLRIKQTGGRFTTNPETLIKSLLDSESKQVLIDGEPAIDGVDMYPADNKEVGRNVVIPDGTLITSVPTFLQEKLRGVYNGGMGTFFQKYDDKKLWFVFPPYDTKGFEKGDNKIIFFAVPQEKLPQLDRSFRKEGKTVRVAVTAQRRYNDSAEVGVMNEGSGFRLPDSSAFMRKPVQITGSGPRASRAELVHESVIKQREDGLNFAPMAKDGPANPFDARSRVAARMLGQIDLVWENGDPSLIYPGMPCQYQYLSRSKVISLTGRILFLHAMTSRVEKYGMQSYRTNCRITIACEQMEDQPDVKSRTTGGGL